MTGAKDSGSKLRWLLWLIVGVTLVRAMVAVRVPLIDDEAYYWLWAHHLDWSYLDHPPMIAYLVSLSTRLGDSALWIRLSALLLGAATTYAVFLLGRELFDARAGIMAAALFQIVPVLAGGALLATPDAPLFLTWTVALRFAWQAMHGRPERWTAAGVALGLGLLSKLYMVFLGVGLILFMGLSARAWFARKESYRAAALAALLFLPVVYWNATHHWAAIRFILYERPGGTPRGLAGAAELLTQQLAFVLPLFFAMVWAIWVGWRRRADQRYAFLLWTSLPAFLSPLLAAVAFGAPHGNWLGPGYLGLIIVLGAVWNPVIAVLAAVNAAVIVYGFAVPLISALPPLPGAGDLYGWREAAVRVQQDAAQLGPHTVIIADRYQVAAQLAYYTRNTLPVTLLPCPNPASIWPPPELFDGAEALAVIDARWTPVVQWDRYAARVEEAPPVAVQFHGRALRTFRIFRLHRLNPAQCEQSTQSSRSTLSTN